MMTVLIVTERFLPRAPAPLIAVALGIIGTSLLGLQSHGVALVGRIPKGFPPITIPDFSLAKQLWPGALGIALMSFTETIAAGRAFAEGEEPPPRANRELFATGLANAGGAFLGAMPGGGGTTQTAVNRLAGARTQLAEVRKKLTQKYKLKLEPPFRCDFRDPWGNRIQVVDLHDESLIWLLPYREVQKTGIKIDSK